jgi:hypothetical protein
MWNPRNHSDEDNLRWCWLRAVEWGNWPVFLSQTYAPVLLIWLTWKEVIIGVFLANLLWALFIRSNFISVPLADLGFFVVFPRWITWLVATGVLFYLWKQPECWVSVAWPAIIYPLMLFTPTKIGLVQDRFMRELGYDKKDAPSKTGTIQAHLIGRPPQYDDPVLLEKWLSNGGKTYRVETWQIGADVSFQQAAENRDPESGDLYVCYQIVEGEWKGRFVDPQLFAQFRSVEERD